MEFDIYKFLCELSMKNVNVGVKSTYEILSPLSKLQSVHVMSIDESISYVNS